MKSKMAKQVKQLKAKARKISKAASFMGLSLSETLEKMGPNKSDFLYSKEWRELRVKVLDAYGPTCMKCMSTKRINVDHIKPRSFYPELALDFNNLQVLCSVCNKAKGNKHSTDYRPSNWQTLSLEKTQ